MAKTTSQHVAQTVCDGLYMNESAKSLGIWGNVRGARESSALPAGSEESPNFWLFAVILFIFTAIFSIFGSADSDRKIVSTSDSDSGEDQ